MEESLCTVHSLPPQPQEVSPGIKSRCRGGKADAPSLGCCNTLYMSTITISVKLVFLMKSWGKASAQSQGCRKSILNILLPEWINNQDVLVI